MATVSTFGFDDSTFRRLQQIQRQYHDALYKTGMIPALAEWQKQMNNISQIDIAPSVKALESISGLYTPKAMETLAAAQKLSESLAPLTRRLAIETNWLSSLIPSIDVSLQNAVAYSWEEMTQGKTGATVLSFLEDFDEELYPEEMQDMDIPDLTENEKNEIVSDINAVINDKPNWQQCLMEKFHEWKVKNPIVAGLLVWIIAILVETHIIVPAATEIGQTIKRAVVREEPNTNSVVISQVEEAHNVVIIDAVPYYYYVEFNDPVSNELLCGYISKKSVFHLSDDASAVMESEAGE